QTPSHRASPCFPYTTLFRSCEQHLCRGRLLLGLAALQLADRVLQQARVRVQADGMNEARLFRTEDVARATQLEVLQRDRVAAAQFGEMLQDAQPLFRLVADALRDEEVTVRAMV